MHDADLVEAAAALRRREFPQAETMLRARLRQRPDDVAAREMLARALIRDYRPAEALAEAERLPASDASHRMLLAAILAMMGEYERARATYQALLAGHPGLSRAWLSLGHVHGAIGTIDLADAAYRRALAIDADFAEAWWSLANLKTMRFSPGDLVAMRAALARTGDLHLHFALGKALEDAGDPAGAFDHYRQGNALARAERGWDAERLHRRIAALAQALGPVPEGYGVPDHDPIFIVGLPRAGSTLIEQILASHPAIEGTMELPDLPAIAERLRGGGTLGQALARLDRAESAALGAEYLARTRVHRKLGRARFIDKLPNNWRYIPLIRTILPNARIIDARRHPLACCFSAYRQHFAGQPFAYDLTDLGRYYRDYAGFMAAVDRAMPGAVHRVFYEAMVQDTEAQVRALLAWLELPFDPACLAFWRNDRAVSTASAQQVRRPIFREGLDQWTRFEPFLDPLKATLGPVLDAYPIALRQRT
jgi:tetratricopeptide (TPR) repeat protein